jgi:hypothetical protein
MTVGSLEQRPGLLDGQRAALASRSGRGRDDGRDVAGDEPLALSVAQHLDEDAPHLVQAGP